MELSQTQQLVQTLYKTESGYPILLTPGQDEIFSAIFKRDHKRVHIMCHTRYGKSLTVGLAVLTRAATFPEKWAILAGTKEKAKIIMEYVIAHIFDNVFTSERFQKDEGEKEEAIRRHRNKSRITFKVGEKIDELTGKKVSLFGEIYIGGAKDALGFGAPNVILDEAALVDDPDYSLA